MTALEKLLALHARLTDDSRTAFTVTKAPEQEEKPGRIERADWSDADRQRWTVRVRACDLVRTPAGEAWMNDHAHYQRIRASLLENGLSKEEIEAAVLQRFGVADASRFFGALGLREGA